MRRVPRLLSVVATAAVVFTLMAPARAADLDSAKKMYDELCARCHGGKGFGDGLDGATLATKPRNFHDCPLMAKDSDDLVVHEIKNGSSSIGRSNDMPSWGAALEDNEVRNLVAFIRTFCPGK